MRLAMIYSLVDLSDRIEERHLLAALLLVDRGLGGDQFRGSAGTGGWVAVRVGRGSNS